MGTGTVLPLPSDTLSITGGEGGHRPGRVVMMVLSGTAKSKEHFKKGAYSMLGVVTLLCTGI